MSGNPAALDGKPVVPDFAKVQPGMRGCGREIGDEAQTSAAAWAAVMVALAIGRWRKRAF